MSLRAEENSGDAGKMFLQQKDTNLVVVTLPILFLLRACSESQPESVKKPLKGLKQLSFSLEERIHKRELFRSFRGLFPF